MEKMSVPGFGGKVNNFSSLSGTDDINKMKTTFKNTNKYSFTYIEARKRADELLLKETK